ncbi:hypothetical protein RIF29_33074 [Crotalaria pallida]|uniref:Uncharacterized protein n=1 Tax=Crotalaria pallida TaxID=3830 RepID=A0AAN9E7Q0_CROPI
MFYNGHIRTIFPNSNQSGLFVNTRKKETSSLFPPLKKLFVAQRNCNSSNLDYKLEEPYCKWPEKMILSEVETSNVSCKKSNSTGFSKQWRCRKDLNLRSNSEGQDTFVFLNPSLWAPPKQESLKDIKCKNVPKNKTQEGNSKTTFSAYEKHYGMRRMRKESDKRKSFLPYKQVLVGFFANADRFSRNLHPF